MPMHKFYPMLVIVTIYVLVGALYARQTPAWQAPDEPAHYNYVRQLADGRLPVMALGDYDEAYRHEVISARFDPRYDLSTITYEDWQPPLYYLLQTPVYWLTGGSLFAMRLVSVLLGAGVVILAYGAARLLFPRQPWVAWTTAVFVAFLPQHVAIMASVNNDALAELLIAAIANLLLRWASLPGAQPRQLLAMGTLLGLGFLTKGTVYLMAPVVGAALVWRYGRQWRAFIRHGMQLFGPALLLGALWWGRNMAVYGGLDFMGKVRHDAVVIGQIRTAEWVTLYGVMGTMQRFGQTTFNSFWGQFGWMALPLLNPPWLYPLLWLLVGTAVLGLMLTPFVWSQGKRSVHARLAPPKGTASEGAASEGATSEGATSEGLVPSPHQVSTSHLQIFLLLLLFLLTVGLHVGYNLTFVQHQGRYLFPALLPISLGLAIGWETVIWLLIRPWLPRFAWLFYMLPVGLGLGLVGLDVYALYRVIIPHLT